MRQKMHACNQSVSRLNAKELKILPFSLRFPFPSPKRNIHMSVMYLTLVTRERDIKRRHHS